MGERVGFIYGGAWWWVIEYMYVYDVCVYDMYMMCLNVRVCERVCKLGVFD